MTDSPPFQFETLIYYKDGNDFFIKDSNFRTYYQKIKGYEKFNIICQKKDKDTCKLLKADSEKISQIFSVIFQRPISKEQIDQNIKSKDTKPSQLQAAKSPSAPTKKTELKQPPATPTTTPSTTNSQDNHQKTASKAPSAPVPEFSFDNLFYYKYDENNKKGYVVNSEKFIELYKEKNIYDKTKICGSRIDKKGTFLLKTDDPNKMSDIFSLIFDTNITPEQVIEHTSNPKLSKTPTSPYPQPNLLPNQLIKSPSTPVNKFTPTNAQPSKTNQPNTI